MSSSTKTSSNTQYDEQQALNGWPSGTAQGGAGVAINHGGYVQYAVVDNSKQLLIMVSNPVKYQQSGQFSDLNSWTCRPVASAFPGSLKNQFAVDNLLAAVSVGDYNYFFWSNSSSGKLAYYALRTSPDLTSSSMAWAQVHLSNDSGHTYQGNMACVALPDNWPDIAGKLGCVFLYKASSGYYLRTMLLDPATFVPSSSWTPTDLKNQHNTPLSSTIDSSYTCLSAGWTSQGAGLPDDASTFVANVSLVVVVGNKKKNITYSGDLLAAFSPAYNKAQDESLTQRQTQVKLAALATNPSVDDNTSLMLCTAPDGELLAQYSNDGNVTYALFSPGSSSSQAGSWKGYAVAASMPSHSTHNTPATVFVPLAQTSGNSPVPVPDPNKKAKTYPDCPLQQYVQLTFATDSNHQPKVITAYWGTFFTIMGYSSAQHTGTRQFAATLMADTFPFPIPAPGHSILNPCCEYEYLLGKNNDTSIESSLRSSVGMRFETTDLVAGVGVKVEGGVSAGFSLALSNSASTSTATELTVETNTTDSTGHISPVSTVFSMSAPTTILTDVAMLLRRGEQQPSGNLAVSLRPKADTSARPYATSYNSYLYTPGDINSYDPDDIDRLMASKFAALSDDDKQDFVINGEDFSYLYTGTNYINSITKRFGYAEFGPSSNQPYLSFSFASGGTQRTAFQATSSFRVGGSLFVDGNLYGGMAWNASPEASVGFLGIVSLQIPVLETSGYVMVGAELASELGTASTSTTEWGVNLTSFSNPLADGEEYTVRMYILQPSPLWARELQHFGHLASNQSVDTVNSSPVRILFTVPSSSVSTPLRNRLKGDF